MTSQTISKRSGSLTEAQIEEYDREGYIVIPDLLSYDDMAPAREAMMHKVGIIADELVEAGLITDKLENEPFETRLALLFDGLSDADFLRFGRGWRDRYAGYYRFMCMPKIVDVVESLIGGELFSNPVYNVRPKVPGVAAGAVPWHQDKSYWPDANANPVITTWIPLVESNAENGCLHLIPRTHKKRAIKHGSETYSGTGYLALDDEYMEGRKREVKALPMSAGSAIFFNDRLIHSSTANNSSSVRWSLDLRYQPSTRTRCLVMASGSWFVRDCTPSEWLPKKTGSRDVWSMKPLSFRGRLVFRFRRFGWRPV